MSKPICIGCFSAFWGDSISAAEQLVLQEGPKLDYLVADYLAEVTMGLLARRREQKPGRKGKDLGGAGEGGYIAEFVSFVIQRLLPDLLKHNIKIVTNAGGLNPLACKKAIEDAIRDAGIEEGKVIVSAVTGDDILPVVDDIKKEGNLLDFNYIEGEDLSSESYPKDEKNVVSFNVYLGAIPVAKALDAGATIVVTGRCVDSALVLGPLLHEFKWDPTNDWDKLASGSLAGHIIECGCQATGGNFTDWEQSAFSEGGGWQNIGYPIVECFPDGEFVVTKPAGTGGVVTLATVGEQMLYEILDPGAYTLPDVVLDLRDVKLEQIGKNRVKVSGAKGRPPTPFLKASGIFLDGYKITGELVIGGIDAWKKAIAVGHAILARSRLMFRKLGMEDFRATNVEPLGAEHTYGPHSRSLNSREVVLRITAHHNNAQALRLFGMELAPAATCMAPGITGGGSGRPHPSPNLVHFSCLIRKVAVTALITVGKEPVQTILFNDLVYNEIVQPSPLEQDTSEEVADFTEKTIRIPLIKLAWGRSGDKGDICNIGILARDRKYYRLLKKALTEEAVKEYMAHLCKGTVKRYELPGCQGLNFVLTKSLGGGGLSSLQVDRQGKTFAQMLLSFLIEVPNSWISKL